jgi:hypothetical protein
LFDPRRQGTNQTAATINYTNPSKIFARPRATLGSRRLDKFLWSEITEQVFDVEAAKGGHGRGTRESGLTSKRSGHPMND